MFRKQLYYIYTLTNLETGNIFYVGSTHCPAQRERTHRYGSNTRVYKYIKENNIEYQFDVIEEVWANTKDDIRTAETFWIHYMHNQGRTFLNKNLIAVSFSFSENRIALK